MTVEQNFPLCRKIQTAKQFDNRGFSGAVYPYKRNLFPRTNPETDITDGVILRIGITKTDVFKFDVNPIMRNRDSLSAVPAGCNFLRFAKLCDLKVLFMNIVEMIRKTGKRIGKRGDCRKIKHKISGGHFSFEKQHNEINICKTVAQ